MVVEDNFKINTKKYMLFYEFEKMWLILTIVNIIAVFLIIRGSTAPLIIHNRTLEIIFCTNKQADKTIYNITVSYFAAYIFYMIQIYYQERRKTVNALLSVRTSVRNMILWTSRFLYVWEIYVQKNGEVIKSAKIEILYLCDGTGFIYKVDKQDFYRMVCEVKDCYDDITSNVLFQESDYAFKKLILGENIYERIYRLYEIANEAELLNEAGSISIGYSEMGNNLLKTKLKYLQSLLDISVNTDFEVVTSKKDIHKYEKRNMMIMKEIENNLEFFKKFASEKEKN